jgi:hypothetical protein
MHTLKSNVRRGSFLHFCCSCARALVLWMLCMNPRPMARPKVSFLFSLVFAVYHDASKCSHAHMCQPPSWLAGWLRFRGELQRDQKLFFVFISFCGFSGCPHGSLGSNLMSCDGSIEQMRDIPLVGGIESRAVSWMSWLECQSFDCSASNMNLIPSSAEVAPHLYQVDWLDVIWCS